MSDEEIKISWPMKLLLKFWPKIAIKVLARKQGINDSLFDQAHNIFSKTKRIDIFPFSPAKGGFRGFMIVIDQETALYFYQDGDHFAYDGFEVGKYNRGEVTVFDEIGKEHEKARQK